MSEVWLLVQGLNYPVDGERVRVSGLVDAKLVHVRCDLTAALSESEGWVSEAICNLHDGFLVKASSEAPGPPAEGSSDQA